MRLGLDSPSLPNFDVKLPQLEPGVFVFPFLLTSSCCSLIYEFWLSIFSIFVLWCLRLTYGLDYKGNVCGDKHAHPGLSELELRYWLNPNQVYQTGLKDSLFTLPDARAICLLDCPTPTDDALTWVCDYPEGEIKLSMDEWIDRNYDYFEFLTPEMRNTSLQLLGPCYPVIFPTVNGKFYETNLHISNNSQTNKSVNFPFFFITNIESL